MQSTAPGVNHHPVDFYSETTPIPSIQRFFKEGLIEAIQNASQEEESEEDELESCHEDENPQQQPLQPQASIKSHRNILASKSDNHPSRWSSLFSSNKNSGHIDGERDRPNDVSVQDESKQQPQQQQVQERRQDQQQQGGRLSDEKVAREEKRRSDPATALKKSSKPRVVDDPITHHRIWAHDVGKHEYNHAIHDQDHGLSSTQNIATFPFPPSQPLPISLQDIHPHLLPLFAAWSVLTLSGLLSRWISIGLIAWLAWWAWQTLLSGVEDQRWERERKRAKKATRKRHPNPDPTQPTDPSDRSITEGTEWLNRLMERLWSVMNPEQFSSLGSTLEDVMQASIPSFIHAVKVQDLDQGSTPLRITGVRILPDREVEDLRDAAVKHLLEKRRKERQKYSRPASSQQHQHAGPPTSHDNHHGDRDTDEVDHQHWPTPGSACSYVNLELSFVYRARPTSNSADADAKSRNAHMLIKFGVGAKKLYSIPLPVWVEIKGFVGTVRLRIQLTPDPPFVKNVTFSFCGLPRVGVQVVPLRINTANIPFLSGFIQSSMDAAIGEYVAPSSMTLDLGEMIMGDNIKRHVHALGVVVVYIHSATELEKQDIRGLSDPYCTLNFAKLGKIQYSSRAVLNELSPRWEERHVMVITPEHLRSKEKISITLWDADRFSSDEMLGRAEIDLLQLVNRPGKLFRRSDPLIGMTHEKKKQGVIHWSLGFFTKATATSSTAAPATDTSNSDPIRSTGGNKATVAGAGADAEQETQQKTNDTSLDTLPESGSGEDAKTNRQRRLSTESISIEDLAPSADEEARQTRNQASNVEFEPPAPSLPSGILSVQIHQLADLEVTDVGSGRQRKRGKRKGDKYLGAQYYNHVEVQEESDYSPSHVGVFLNDEAIFRTRTKALNKQPFFNAGTERFIRDWRSTRLVFAVYDYRMREADAILGTVSIRLEQLFSVSSQVTQFFPISGGIGHGSIRLSLLFQPIVQISRMRNKIGWNIGAVQLLSSPVVTGMASNVDLKFTHFRASTFGGHLKISHRQSITAVDWNGSWANMMPYEDVDVDDEDKQEEEEEEGQQERRKQDRSSFSIPVIHRYSIPLILEFRSFHFLKLSTSNPTRTMAMSVVWLQDLADNHLHELTLPLYRSKDGSGFHRLRHNYHCFRNEQEAIDLGVEPIGRLKISLQFLPGINQAHVSMSLNEDVKRVLEIHKCLDVVGNYGRPSFDPNRHENRKEFQVKNVETRADDLNPMQTHSLQQHGDQSLDQQDLEQGSPPPPSLPCSSTTSPSPSLTSPSTSVVERFSEWRQRHKELHRQHKDLLKYKPVRTASWIKDSTKSTAKKVLKKRNLHDRSFQHVKSEL